MELYDNSSMFAELIVTMECFYKERNRELKSMDLDSLTAACHKRGIDIICIDEVPYIWKEPGLSEGIFLRYAGGGG